MSRHAKDRRPYLPPVNRIELSEQNTRRRWVLLIALMVVAVVSIGLGIHYALEVDPGWHDIQTLCDEPNYSDEFVLMYDFSGTEGNAAADQKTLALLYSDAMEESYRIFDKDAQVEGRKNLHYLSTHPNETVTVDAPLYEALHLLTSYENRCIYLAPVYAEYSRVVNAETEVEAMLYDPRFDPDAAAYIAQLMVFAGEESAVNLELFGSNQVRLHVSEAYLAFAQANEILEFLALGWMRNAFVADYVAQTLIARGFTAGYLASFDGFTRSLSDAGELNLNIFHREGKDIYAPAKMTYQAPMSIVSLRDYPLSDMDRWTYFVYEDATITSMLIDPEDGDCETGISALTCYGQNTGCAEILMQMLPTFFADSFDGDSLKAIYADGIYAIWCDTGILYYNQENLALEILENAQGIRYKTEFVS